MMVKPVIPRIKKAKSRIILQYKVINKIMIDLIKKAKSRIILGLIMSVTMATVLSFVITLSYAGFVPNLLSIWMQRLVISLTVGPPVALVLLPLVIRLVGKIVRLDISLSGQGGVQTK